MRGAAVIAVLLLWAWPLLAGMVDVAAWIAVGHGVTSIIWGDRAPVAFLWVVAGGLVAGPLISAISA